MTGGLAGHADIAHFIRRIVSRRTFFLVLRWLDLAGFFCACGMSDWCSLRRTLDWSSVS